MSEIDRIVNETVAQFMDEATPEQIKAKIRAALLEYGQIVREECAKVCDDLGAAKSEPRSAYDAIEAKTYYRCRDAIRNANKG